jgi:TIR domain
VEIAMTAPVVFVSYSHDSQEHKRWVLDLATRLRNSGIDAILDQWDLGPGGDLPHFMEQSIARSARILMICTERYVEKANAGLGGVGYEKMIVTADLLKRIGSNRVIPIVRQSGTTTLPIFLESKVYINLSSADQFETGMDQLLRELLNAPLFDKPPIGSSPLLLAMPSKPSQPDPLTQFMKAVAAIYEGSGSNGALRTVDVRKAMGTSKLFFDYARDLAESRKYVSVGATGETIWVKDEGRRAIIQLSSDGDAA